MAAENSRKSLQEEGTCPICLEYFGDPVMLDCGHNFCRGCITQTWEETSEEALCPQCRETVQSSNLKPNRQLASMVDLVKEMGEMPRAEATEWSACWKHQEPMKLFCQDDGAPICLVCDKSKEHRSHLVVPLEEAAQEVKDKISCSLGSLRKEKEYILAQKGKNVKESEDLLEQIELERETTTATFKNLRRFLEDKERYLLAQMEVVELEIVKRKNEHQTRLSGELSFLDNLLQEQEGKLQHSANELLQDLENALEKCKKEPFKNPRAFPLALLWKIHDFGDINPYLEGVMKQFRDSLVYGLSLQQANVTLDPDTAHPELVVSENCKTVSVAEKKQVLPNNPERFDFWHFVLGCEQFTAGRHLWEVTVDSEGTWCVGVARKTVRRKGKFELCPKEGIWEMGTNEEGDYIPQVAHPSEYASPFLNQEIKRIRVTLNCAGGRVAFFDADTGEKLYEYSDVALRREILLPLFFIVDDGYLAICP